MMFDISAEQRSRLAGGVVGSRAGRSQCSLLAGGVVCAGWSVQRVGTYQIHLWHTTQEGGGLSRGESLGVRGLMNDKNDAPSCYLHESSTVLLTKFFT